MLIRYLYFLLVPLGNIGDFMILYYLLILALCFIKALDGQIHNTPPKALQAQSLFPLRSLILPGQAIQKKAIIIGASSGMGNALAKHLLAEGYLVGITARRTDRLETVKQTYPANTLIRYMDVAKPEEAVTVLNQLVADMQGIDLCVIASSGYYDQEPAARSWDFNQPLLAVDVLGVSALVRTAINIFESQGSGHLVCFSSVDGYHGLATCPLYSAVKMFLSRFLDGERNRCIQLNLPITITELIPGWVNANPEHGGDNPAPGAYWVESLDDATETIYKAITEKAPKAYVTARQEKLVDLLKTIPNDLYNALCARPGGAF